MYILCCIGSSCQAADLEELSVLPRASPTMDWIEKSKLDCSAVNRAAPKSVEK